MSDSAYRSLQRRVVFFTSICLVAIVHINMVGPILDCHYCEKENTAETSKYLLLLNTFFPSIVLKLA